LENLCFDGNWTEPISFTYLHKAIADRHRLPTTFAPKGTTYKSENAAVSRIGEARNVTYALISTRRYLDDCGAHENASGANDAPKTDVNLKTGLEIVLIYIIQ
jgi:hypothetical protein